MIQATFFTLKWGHFSLSMGRQQVSSVLRRQEEVKQTPAKETDKKRDGKKAELQRGSTQPTGKNSILKEMEEVVSSRMTTQKKNEIH